jgi:hypothetical protein
MEPLSSKPASGPKLPPPPQTDFPFSERRARVRSASQFGTFFQTLSGENRSYSARIQNISRGGINLIANCRFEPRTRLVILLRPVVEAHLVHAIQTPDGRWSLGCAFVTELSEQDLTTLLEISALDTPLAPSCHSPVE